MGNSRNEMITPRAYLSWSSMSLFESNLENWKRVYLYGERMPINQGMAFGKKMAEGLENDEATGDPILDLVMISLPKFEIMDKPVTVSFSSGKKTVPLLIKPDTMKADMSAFKEYKTGQAPWSRKQVDESGQITFYAVGLYLKTGHIPDDIELVHVQTEKIDEYGRIGATGEIYRHPTKRTMVDVIKMMARMRKAWEGIQNITAGSLF